MSKEIEKWLGKRLAEYGMEKNLPPRAIKDKLDACKELVELEEERANRQGRSLSSEEKLEIYDSCATGILRGEDPEEKLRRRGY